MIVFYILIAVNVLVWLYCRVGYYILRQPADTFWRFLRRNLVPGASVSIQVVDLLIKLTATGLTLYWLWLQF